MEFSESDTKISCIFSIFFFTVKECCLQKIPSYKSNKFQSLQLCRNIIHCKNEFAFQKSKYLEFPSKKLDFSSDFIYFHRLIGDLLKLIKVHIYVFAYK